MTLPHKCYRQRRQCKRNALENVRILDVGSISGCRRVGERWCMHDGVNQKIKNEKKCKKTRPKSHNWPWKGLFFANFWHFFHFLLFCLMCVGRDVSTWPGKNSWGPAVNRASPGDPTLDLWAGGPTNFWPPFPQGFVLAWRMCHAAPQDPHTRTFCYCRACGIAQLFYVSDMLCYV